MTNSDLPIRVRHPQLPLCFGNGKPLKIAPKRKKETACAKTKSDGVRQNKKKQTACAKTATSPHTHTHTCHPPWEFASSFRSWSGA